MSATIDIQEAGRCLSVFWFVLLHRQLLLWKSLLQNNLQDDAVNSTLVNAKFLPEISRHFFVGFRSSVSLHTNHAAISSRNITDRWRNYFHPATVLTFIVAGIQTTRIPRSEHYRINVPDVIVLDSDPISPQPLSDHFRRSDDSWKCIPGKAG